MDEYTGFLFADKEGVPLVAMYWEHRFNHMVKRYNDIYRVQMPNITLMSAATLTAAIWRSQA